MVAYQDLVVVVPGILGSRLVRVEKGQNGPRTKVVWDLSVRRLPRLFATALTGGLELDESDDSIVADRLFDFQLLPGFFGVDDYASLVAYLGALTGAEQVVSFPYDWRRSNGVAAEQLGTVVGDGLRRLRDAGATEPKAWLVCHSMGGLVARYYCEELGGAAQTRAIITLGTPHRGSVAALDALVNGKQYGLLNLTNVVRSFPSVYELLPLFPVLRAGTGTDLKLVRLAESFGLDPVSGADLDISQQDGAGQVPHLDRKMLQDALRFHAAIRVPAEARNPGETSYAQHAILNRRQHTLHSAAVRGDGLDTFRTYPVLELGVWREEDARGDGTVPAQSSVPIEWADTSAAVTNAQKHTGIQATKEAHMAIGNWLRPADARPFRGGAVADADVLILDVPSVVQASQPLTVTVAAGRTTSATVEVVDMSTEPERARTFKQPVAVTEEPRPIVFEGLAPGMYRVTAVPRSAAQPSVSDYTLVDAAGG